MEQRRDGREADAGLQGVVLWRSGPSGSAGELVGEARWQSGLVGWWWKTFEDWVFFPFFFAAEL